jgi:hypothetical protein
VDAGRRILSRSRLDDDLSAEAGPEPAQLLDRLAAGDTIRRF